jgi:hypothetical protein
MPLRRYFSSTIWFGSGLRGRILRRVSIAFILLLLSVATASHIYSFVLARRFQAVISGLSKIRIDQTTEEETTKLVPYLVPSQLGWEEKRTPETGDIDLGYEHSYYVTISNEWSWMKFRGFAASFSSVRYSKDDRPQSWILEVANLLGYRYMAFGARVDLLNDKVSSVSYGIADNLVFPRELGTIVSVKSVHAFWAPYQRGFEVRSTDDENPQFRVNGSEHHLDVLYTFDAPPTMMSRAYKVDLSCFWGLLGCHQARQIAPLLFQDAERIQQDALARLRSTDPCPARIVAGRSKYLTDVSVSLIESEGLRREPANMEGSLGIRTVTDYKLIEVLRGFPVQSLKSVEVRSSVPLPGDYTKQLPNFGPQWPERGKQILLFSNHHFDSCQLVPAVPEAIAAVRNTARAPKRREDETICCVM